MWRFNDHYKKQTIKSIKKKADRKIIPVSFLYRDPQFDKIFQNSIILL